MFKFVSLMRKKIEDRVDAFNADLQNVCFYNPLEKFILALLIHNPPLRALPHIVLDNEKNYN